MDRVFKTSILIIFIFIFSSCLSNRIQFPLKFEKASSQTWDAGTKYRGTKLEVVLVGETEHVKITNLIFRSKCIIPMIKRRDGKLFLTADFESGTENKIDDSMPVNKVDMIIYTYKGKVYELPLKDIQRKPMRYYPKQ